MRFESAQKARGAEERAEKSGPRKHGRANLIRGQLIHESARRRAPVYKFRRRPLNGPSINRIHCAAIVGPRARPLGYKQVVARYKQTVALNQSNLRGTAVLWLGAGLFGGGQRGDGLEWDEKLD